MGRRIWGSDGEGKMNWKNSGESDASHLKTGAFEWGCGGRVSKCAFAKN